MPLQLGGLFSVRGMGLVGIGSQLPVLEEELLQLFLHLAQLPQQ